MKDIWIPLSAAVAQQQQIDVMANNVANINTPGFKKDQMTFKEYLTVLNRPAETVDLPSREWRPGDFYRSDGAEHGYVKSEGTYTIFKQGTLSPTGNPLDCAIFGEGFFEVLTEEGPRLTRKGTFTLSNKGELITEQGHKLLAAKSEEAPAAANVVNPADNPGSLDDINKRILIIPATVGKININQQGEIFAGRQAVGQLSIVELKDTHALRKEGSSLFINPDEKNANRNEIKSIVHQGFIEGSNVDAVGEMASLIKANRHFETIQRAIKTYDSIANRGVNDIAKF